MYLSNDRWYMNPSLLVVFIVAVMWYSFDSFMNTPFLVEWFFNLYFNELLSPLFNLELICLQFSAPNIWFVHWAACLDTAHSLLLTFYFYFILF